MPTPVLMPALSPTMEEGVLAKWTVKEGDKVSAGDVIAEIETDKATMEVEAVDEGTIGKILVAEGAEGVKVNAPIAVLLEEGESAEDIDLSKLEGGESSNGGANGEAKADAPSPEKPAGAPADEATARGAAETTGATKPSASAGSSANGRVFASPLAKRMAKLEGLDLSALKGSGPHGRVVKRDVEKALKEGTGKAAPASGPAQTFTPSPASVDPRLYPADSYEAVKLDGMRKTIAKRLSQSFNGEVPHFPLNIDCEIDGLLAARARVNAMSPDPEKDPENAYKVSVNDFVMKACALALKKVPAANASYTDEAILYHKHADIGMAVAIEGGLITPIIWKAEEKGLAQISREAKDLAGRARKRKLKPEEYQGGTFSVSNLGMFGITSFASIVNQPHGAIMSVGAGIEKPVVKNGKIEIATVMTVTLTCDHRVVDGAIGAQFLAAFKQFIEEPAAMLL